MDYNLNFDHPLWRELTAQNPQWWQNLKSDPDISCDVRKNNYLNFYYNGGWQGTSGIQDMGWHHYAAVAQEGTTVALLYIDVISDFRVKKK